MNPSIDSKRYLYSPLQTENGPKNCRIHRLVMMTFCYFVGCENIIINHKDGNKLNPTITNLEWSTFSKNIKHAYDTGLHNIVRGEENWVSSHINDQVIKVCELLQLNKNSSDIAKILGVSIDFIDSIKYKKAWAHISSEYIIQDPLPIEERRVLQESDAVRICKYYQNNKKPESIYKKDYIIKMINELNLPNNEKIFNACINIYNRRSFKYISKDYEF